MKAQHFASLFCCSFLFQQEFPSVKPNCWVSPLLREQVQCQEICRFLCPREPPGMTFMITSGIVSSPGNSMCHHLNCAKRKIWFKLFILICGATMFGRCFVFIPILVTSAMRRFNSLKYLLMWSFYVKCPSQPRTLVSLDQQYHLLYHRKSLWKATQIH